ncbi:hypothetical protein Y981_10605 [Leptospirillum ferriphilum YSK]|uniref:Uncharacterized protein n=2 Tax=Leptospirillum ferriphilum TaxID=178606 RepID=A0A059Y2X7_9BACT|nr:hypothetical protein Y981_10605 [Leptospirillum ferriphilum YSK]
MACSSVLSGMGRHEDENGQHSIREKTRTPTQKSFVRKRLILAGIRQDGLRWIPMSGRRHVTGINGIRSHLRKEVGDRGLV